MIFEIGKLYDLTVLMDNGGAAPEQCEFALCRVEAVEGSLVKFDRYSQEMIFNVASYAFVCAQPSDESNIHDDMLGDVDGLIEG